MAAIRVSVLKSLRSSINSSTVRSIRQIDTRPVITCIDRHHSTKYPVDFQYNRFNRVSGLLPAFSSTSPLLSYRSFSLPSGIPEVSGASGGSTPDSGVIGSDWLDKAKDACKSAVDAASFTGKKAKEASNEMSGIPEVPECSGGSTSDSGVIGSDWLDKAKDAWKSAVDAASFTGEKAKEASNEMSPYVEQLLNTHPYLRDVIVPVGGTVVGTLLAWAVMPRVLKRFHRYSTEGPAILLSGSSVWGPVPYEKSFWGALEDPLRYLVTFMAFSQIVAMVAPTTIASHYLMQTWRGAVILSGVWFLHRWKTNVISRALEGKTVQIVDRDKLLTVDKISSVGLFVIGLMALAEACGVAAQSIITVGGIGGVATAFAYRNILRNVLSGLSVQLSRPFSIGDTIQVDIDAVDWRMTDRIPIRDQGESPYASLTLLDYRAIISGQPTRAAKNLEHQLSNLTEDEIEKIKKIYIKCGDTPREFTMDSILDGDNCIKYSKYTPKLAKKLVEEHPLLIMVKTGEGIYSVDLEDPFDDGDEWNYKVKEDDRHCMVLVGFFGEYLILQNTWGKNFGCLGFCYLNENSKGIIEIATIRSPKQTCVQPKKGIEVIKVINDIKNKAKIEREKEITFEVDRIERYINDLKIEIVILEREAFKGKGNAWYNVVKKSKLIENLQQKIEEVEGEEKAMLIRNLENEVLEKKEMVTFLKELEDESFEKRLKVKNLNEELKLSEADLLIKKEKLRLLVLRREMQY